jgi:AraC-like DNA-binding protein
MRSPTVVGTHFRFSTGALAECERLPAWRDVLVRTLGKVDIDPLDRDPFHAEATACRLPALDVVSARSSAMHLSHTPDPSGADALVLVAAPSCAWSVSHLGRTLALHPGDAVLLSNAAAWSITLAADASYIALRLPKAALASGKSDVNAVAARSIPGANLALQLLVSYLASALAIEALSAPELSELAVAQVHHLVAVALGTTRDVAELAGGRALRTARYGAIKSDIVARVDDGELTINAIAAHHHVSARYVQMLFEQEGTTFSEFLLEQRLTRAHCMLTSPRFAACTIGAIAFEVGFNDLSYFNRSFRRRFGATPSEVRAGLGATLIAAE